MYPGSTTVAPGVTPSASLTITESTPETGAPLASHSRPVTTRLSPRPEYCERGRAWPVTHPYTSPTSLISIVLDPSDRPGLALRTLSHQLMISQFSVRFKDV